jgi:TIR domain/Leucine rich repeat/Leucine Rich Repeat
MTLFFPEAFAPIRPTLKNLELADTVNASAILSDLTHGLRGGVLEYLGLSSAGLVEIPKEALLWIALSLLGLALQGNTFHRLGQNSFPEMPMLGTLDIRRCSIIYLEDGAFNGLTSLKNLYLSGNRIKTINKPFIQLQKLIFLDLSNNPDSMTTGEANYDIGKDSFKGLRNLEILSFAKSRIKSISALAFTETKKLKELSLCETNQVSDFEFLKHLQNLTALDLSNNPNIQLNKNLFPNLTNLQKLRLSNCEIEMLHDDVDYFYNFPNLQQLVLSNNQLLHIPKNAFKSLPKLEVLDIDNNHIDSWNSSLFTYNKEMKHLSMDNNQICYMTNATASDMLSMKLLSFQFNPLICDCVLYYFSQELKNLKNSFTTVKHWKDNWDAYTCFNPPDGTNIRMDILTNQTCNTMLDVFVPDPPTLSDPLYVAISAASFLAVVVVLTIGAVYTYKKRSNLRYFGIMVKNALSVALLKDQDDHENQQDQIHIYDVFISYCDADRDWVLQQLLPSLENDNQLRVCLHERDFQPGYGILDNIVHCIDKSRSLILVVSKKSLKSQWCQFEMHLAQHKFIEANKEQLILVMMDDIPKGQRPRTLHYLMATRTFLQWDENTSANFWKRLRRSLQLDKSRPVSIV